MCHLFVSPNSTLYTCAATSMCQCDTYVTSAVCHFDLAHLSTLKVCYYAIVTIATIIIIIASHISLYDYKEQIIHINSDDYEAQIIQVTKERI